MSWELWSLFLPAALLVAASPGAGNFLALSNGLRSGLVPAITALAGRLAAFTLLVALTVAGLGVVLAASETAFSLLKWGGVAYLAWLGVRLWREPELGLDRSEIPRGSPSRLARREFWVALSNPKAILLFTAFLPQFVDPGAPVEAQLARLGAAYIAIEFVAASGYALMGSRLRRLTLGACGARLVNRASGGMMLLVAGLLATAKRTG